MSSALSRSVASIALRVLPEPKISPQERMRLSAHALDMIREIARHFSADSKRMNTPMAALQRPANLACDLMDFVDPAISLIDYVGMVNLALAAWKDELAKKRPSRNKLSAAMRNAMFTDNDAGWQRYAAHMGKEFTWFTADPT